MSEKIGCMEYRYPPRRYTVKPGILKKGCNLIAILLVVNSGIGGFVAQQPHYFERARSAWSLPAFGSMLRKRGRKPRLRPFVHQPWVAGSEY